MKIKAAIIDTQNGTYDLGTIVGTNFRGNFMIQFPHYSGPIEVEREVVYVNYSDMMGEKLCQHICSDSNQESPL